MRHFPILAIAIAFAGLAAGSGSAGEATWATAANRPGVAVTIYSAPSKDESDRQGYSGFGSQFGGVFPTRQMVFDPRENLAQGIGFGVVKEIREVEFPAGTSRYRFSDVAAKIDPPTVRFRSLTDPEGTEVLEQNFEYDLVSAEKLKAKYIDRRVRFDPPPGKEWTPIEGILLSTDGGPVLQTGGEVRLAIPGRMVLPEGAGSLLTRPTLEWLVNAEKSGEQNIEVAYMTEGLSWEADYRAYLDGDQSTIDLFAWVTIWNHSGGTYEDALLKLVAGDVQRLAPVRPQMETLSYASLAPRTRNAEGERGFEEKGFFEYHLYTLGRRTTLPDRSIKQIEMFEPVEGVPVEKIYVYDGAVMPEHYRDPYAQVRRSQPGPNDNRELGTQTNRKVDLYLKFKNEKDDGMGMPLPAGRVRLYMRDPVDGQAEMAGTDWIDHTPKDEELQLRLGSAFDIIGERVQVDFERGVTPIHTPRPRPTPTPPPPGYRGPRPTPPPRPKVERPRSFIRESFAITLRNHKAEPVDVLVRERLYRWKTWEIAKASHEWEKDDASTIHFPVRVPANDETKMTYTVLYTW